MRKFLLALLVFVIGNIVSVIVDYLTTITPFWIWPVSLAASIAVAIWLYWQEIAWIFARRKSSPLHNKEDACWNDAPQAFRNLVDQESRRMGRFSATAVVRKRPPKSTTIGTVKTRKGK